MNLVLDTGILGQLCHPGNAKNQAVCQWLSALLDSEDSDLQIVLPEICDYELRRKLLHLIRQGQATLKSIERLNDLTRILDYLPLETESMHKAAELWVVGQFEIVLNPFSATRVAEMRGKANA